MFKLDMCYILGSSHSETKSGTTVVCWIYQTAILLCDWSAGWSRGLLLKMFCICIFRDNTLSLNIFNKACAILEYLIWLEANKQFVKAFSRENPFPMYNSCFATTSRNLIGTYDAVMALFHIRSPNRVPRGKYTRPWIRWQIFRSLVWPLSTLLWLKIYNKVHTELQIVSYFQNK